MSRRMQQLVMALGLALTLAHLPSQAGVVNGGFETGDFTGFATAGNNSIQTAAFGSGPTEGTFQALLSTAGRTASAASLDTFLGLSAGTLEGQGFASGSAIKQTFTATAGDPLSFDANFLTNAGQGSSDQQAFSFIVTPGGSTPLQLLLLAPVDAADISATIFANESGFQNFADVVPTTGTYTLAFAILSIGGSDFDSGLLVDNFRVAGSTGSNGGNGGNGGSSVPLPLALFAAPLLVATAGAATRRLQRQSR